MTTTDRTCRIGLIHSCWHIDIVGQSLAGVREVTNSAGAAVEVFTVPGAFELPLHARLLANTGRFDAVIAAGFVVDGGIYRHEFVADAVISGLMRVQLDTQLPVFSCVLTPQHFDENNASDQQFFFDHMIEKGREVATACLATLEARRLVPA